MNAVPSLKPCPACAHLHRKVKSLRLDGLRERPEAAEGAQRGRGGSGRGGSKDAGLPAGLAPGSSAAG